MSQAVLGNQSGDVTLALSDYVDVDIAMSDAAVSFDVAGRAGLQNGALVGIAKQTVAGPAVPGAGTTYYILQAAVAAPSAADGTVTLKTSAAATPAPDAGCVELMRSALPSTGNTNPLDDLIATPDKW